MFMATSATAAG